MVILLPQINWAAVMDTFVHTKACCSFILIGFDTCLLALTEIVAMQAFFQGIHPMMVSFLDIRVRREAVLEDALAQLVARHDDLKKPLRVTFISAGVDEEAQVNRPHTARCCGTLAGALRVLCWYFRICKCRMTCIPVRNPDWSGWCT